MISTGSNHSSSTGLRSKERTQSKVVIFSVFSNRPRHPTPNELTSSTLPTGRALAAAPSSWRTATRTRCFIRPRPPVHHETGSGERDHAA